MNGENENSKVIDIEYDVNLSGFASEINGLSIEDALKKIGQKESELFQSTDPVIDRYNGLTIDQEELMQYQFYLKELYKISKEYNNPKAILHMVPKEIEKTR